MGNISSESCESSKQTSGNTQVSLYDLQVSRDTVYRRYSGTLTPTAPTAIRLWETFTITFYFCCDSSLLLVLAVHINTSVHIVSGICLVKVVE